MNTLFLFICLLFFVVLFVVLLCFLLDIVTECNDSSCSDVVHVISIS